MFSIRFTRNCAAVLIVLFANLITSCYTVRALKIENGGFLEQEKNVILPLQGRALVLPIDNENVWLLEKVTVTETTLEAANVRKTTWAEAGKGVSETIRLLVIPGRTVNPEDNKPLVINTADIDKAEIRQVNLGATLGITLVGVSALVLIVAIASTSGGDHGSSSSSSGGSGSSCPFVYCECNGRNQLAGEIFSGAVFPDQERDDYLLLPEIAPRGGLYEVNILNGVQNETQYVNLAELVVCDHPAGTSVLLDKHGRALTFADVRPPLSATNSSGVSVLDAVRSRDDGRFWCSAVQRESDLTDPLICVFERPEGVNKARLVVRAKNTFWLEYVYREFWYLFGDRYGPWVKARTSSTAFSVAWKDIQHVTMSVAKMTNGGWRAVDTLPIAGPIAFRDFVMDIDLSDVPAGETVAVKLDAGRCFWDIDSVGMDFSANGEARQTTLAASTAVDQDGNDLSAKLAHADRDYYVQARYENVSRLQFAAPAAPPLSKRTVFLHTRGYYIVRLDPEPSGAPDIGRLSRMYNEGEFNRFSNQLFFAIRERLKAGGKP